MPRAYIQGGVRIALILGAVALLMYAFGVRGDFGGTTFATGSGTGVPGLELKINSKTYYNGTYQPALSWTLKNLVPGVDKFWNFGDVKPGDTGTSSISIHINKNPAWVCLDFVNLTNNENGINEPESHVDSSTTTGELAAGLEFFAWRDDGDNRFEVGEIPLFGTSSQSGLSVLNTKTYALADSGTGGAYADGSTHYVGIYWCAGDLTVNTATAQASCNGEVLGNEAQTDSMSVDVMIRAVQSKQNAKFLCTPKEEPKYGSIKLWKRVVGETNPDYAKFSFALDNGTPFTFPSGQNWIILNNVPVGTHTISELAISGYTTTYGEASYGNTTIPDSDCELTVTEGNTSYCRVTNTKTTSGDNGQCPAGYTKQVDNYKGGLSWKSDGNYLSAILVGGPAGSTNKDPDGRFKYFSNVSKNQTIARKFHDISHICVKPQTSDTSWYKVESTSMWGSLKKKFTS